MATLKHAAAQAPRATRFAEVTDKKVRQQRAELFAQDLDSARLASKVVNADGASTSAAVTFGELAAENTRLKQALQAREFNKRTKLLLKQKKILKELQVKHALQAAFAEHEELKKVAKAVSKHCMHLMLY